MPNSNLRVAAIQASFGDNRESNIVKAIAMVERAKAEGADIALLPELFEGPYFPQTQRDDHFALACPADSHPTLARFSNLAAKLEMVVVVSFFERAENSYYNSVAVFDRDGRRCGIYRKSHIPDGPGYQEKFYFRPGQTGFLPLETSVGNLGVGICWDQWFPEAARCMALNGADLLLYPTAIGSEPGEPELDTREPWRRVMIGHAVANAIPVVAANRIGIEDEMSFYGCSFIADHRGDLLNTLDGEEGVILAELDLARARRYRASFGFFRDRRPDLYAPIVDKEY